MGQPVKPVPEGHQTVTAVLTVQDAGSLIEFYRKAFGAEERGRFLMPDGKRIMHAEIRIGNSLVMLGDEHPGQPCRSPLGYGGTPVAFYVYVEDVDAVFKQAVAAGASVQMQVENSFWGDRIGTVADPSGHVWTLASRVEEVSPEEMAKRGQEFGEKIAQGAG